MGSAAAALGNCECDSRDTILLDPTAVESYVLPSRQTEASSVQQGTAGCAQYSGGWRCAASTGPVLSSARGHRTGSSARAVLSLGVVQQLGAGHYRKSVALILRTPAEDST